MNYFDENVKNIQIGLCFDGERGIISLNKKYKNVKNVQYEIRSKEDSRWILKEINI